MGFDNVNVNVSGPIQPTSTYKTKVLKGNHSFASQVTEPNMKYVIKHDFDLGGGEVNIPEGCVLEFDGGSLGNGTVIGNNTGIKAELVNIFNTNLTIIGIWNVAEVYPEWFGAKGDEVTDNTIAIAKAIDFCSINSGNYGKTLRFSTGRYGITNTLTLKPGVRLLGVNPRSTWIYAMVGFQGVDDFLIDTVYENNNSPLSSTSISNLQIRCTPTNIGEAFTDTHNGVKCRGWNELCYMTNVQITGYKNFGLYLTKNERTVTQNCVFSDVFIINTNNPNDDSKGVFLDYCNQCVFINLTIDNGSSTVKGAEYGIYGQGGCNLNTFIKLNIEDCYYPIRYDRDEENICSMNGTSFIGLAVNNPTHNLKPYTDLNNNSCVIRGRFSSFTGFNIVSMLTKAADAENSADYDVYIEGYPKARINYKQGSQYKQIINSCITAEGITIPKQQLSTAVNDENIVFGKTDSMANNPIIVCFDNDAANNTGSVINYTGLIDSAYWAVSVNDRKKIVAISKGIQIGDNIVNVSDMPVDSIQLIFKDTNKIIALPRCSNINNITKYRGGFSFDFEDNCLIVCDGAKWMKIPKGVPYGSNFSGTYANRPDNVDVGFGYFCTDKQTSEGSTNGIMIFYKGNNVWVDALGRVVS